MRSPLWIAFAFGSYLFLNSLTAVQAQPPQAPPVLNALNEPKSQLWNAGLTVIDSNATVTDIDSTNFAGGALIVRVVGGLPTDRLSIRSSTAVGKINVSGTNVLLGTTSIGTLTSSVPVTGAAILRINLKATATPAVTTALLRNITYRNQSGIEVLGNRTIQVKVLDGDGGASLAVNKVIKLGTFNGNYLGSFTGSVRLPTGAVINIPGPGIPAGSNDIDLAINNGVATVTLPGVSGGGSGTISFTGLFSAISSGSLGALGVNIEYTGSFALSPTGVATGSGTWTIVNTPGITGSGTWSVQR